jgi:hypothetical protein
MTKKILTFALLATLLAAAIPSLLACKDKKEEQQDVELTTCAPAESPVFEDPTDLPSNLKEYHSKDRGYLVRYPADWEVREGLVAFKGIVGDAFFSPSTDSTGSTIRPNFSVTCEMMPVGIDTEVFFQEKRSIFEKRAGAPISAAIELSIDGKKAYLIEYSLQEQATPQPVALTKVDVLWADERGGWIMSLLVPPEQIDAYRPLFEEFFISFKEK